MGRRRSQKAIESEAKVKEALNTVQIGQIKTGYAAAKRFGASKSTIYRRLSGGKTRAEAREEQQLLSKQEEKALIVWITMLAATGNPVGHGMVREMAEEIREQRVESINEEDCVLVDYPPIGDDWVSRFLGRYPFMATKLSRAIEAARIKDVSSELILEFFDVLTRVMKENDIRLEDIYNMDETGYYFIHFAYDRICIGNHRKILCYYQLYHSKGL